jgi:hypothetical protein
MPIRYVRIVDVEKGVPANRAIRQVHSLIFWQEFWKSEERFLSLERFADLAGLLALLLSILLVIERLAQKRPAFTFYAKKIPGMSDVYYAVNVYNGSSRPILISNIKPLFPRSLNRAFSSMHVEGWKTRDVIESALSAGRVDVLLRPNESLDVEFLMDEDFPKYVLFYVNWRSHGSLPIWRFPRIFFRTRRSLKEIASHPRRVGEDAGKFVE